MHPSIEAEKIKKSPRQAKRGFSFKEIAVAGKGETAPNVRSIKTEAIISSLLAVVKGGDVIRHGIGAESPQRKIGHG